MKQPSDLELLIVPYLDGDISPEDRARVQAEIESDPAFAAMVQDFRETLGLLADQAPQDFEARLDDLDGDIYREIAARSAVNAASARSRRIVGMAVVGASLWGRFGSAAAIAAASLVVGVFLGDRSIAPVQYSPVAEVVAPVRETSHTVRQQHREFQQVEQERQLNEARLIHHVRGDARTALAHYEQLVENSPDSWTSRVAAFEQSAILSTTAVTMPLRRDVKPVFVDVTSP